MKAESIVLRRDTLQNQPKEAAMNRKRKGGRNGQYSMLAWLAGGRLVSSFERELGLDRVSNTILMRDRIISPVWHVSSCDKGDRGSFFAVAIRCGPPSHRGRARTKLGKGV
jgi:hypothetical protein